MIEKKYKKVFGILFSVVVFLLFSEIILEKLYPGIEDKPTITTAEIDTVFNNILDNFGFKSEWYYKKGNTYYVSLPNDLPAELILLDISDYFRGKELEIISKEVIKGSTSVMKLSSGGSDILSAFFSYDKEKKRHTSEISFLLVNPDKLSQSDLSELYESHEMFSFALYPSKKNREMGIYLNRIGKQYAVIINSNIDELEYRLDDKFSDRKLLITIQSIVSHFADAVFFVIDNYDGGMTDRVVLLLQNELSKRNIRYHYLKEFKTIQHYDNVYQLEEILDSNTNNDQVFVVEAGEYTRLKEEMKYLRKRGFRVVPL